MLNPNIPLAGQRQPDNSNQLMNWLAMAQQGKASQWAQSPDNPKNRLANFELQDAENRAFFQEGAMLAGGLAQALGAEGTDASPAGVKNAKRMLLDAQTKYKDNPKMLEAINRNIGMMEAGEYDAIRGGYNKMLTQGQQMGYFPKPSSPVVEVNTGTPKPPYDIPAGYMLKNPEDPSEGVTPIPGGNKDSMTPEQAGKAQQIRIAQATLPRIEKLLFDEDGSPNRWHINTRGMPFSDGRLMASLYEQGIQAITRSETGAAMPDTELDNTRKRFEPSPLDNAETVNAKWQLFNDFINGTVSFIDPSGRFDDARFDEALKTRLETAMPEGLDASITQADWDNMTPEERALFNGTNP